MLQKWTTNAIAIIRIIIGCFMIIHGMEIFSHEKMQGYIDWKLPYPVLMLYFGKSCELLAGILLFFGLFTRVGALIMAATMTGITFMIGHGKFYMEDQHPFLFVLFAFIFFFDGGNKWSLDNMLFKKKR